MKNKILLSLFLSASLLIATRIDGDLTKQMKVQVITELSNQEEQKNSQYPLLIRYDYEILEKGEDILYMSPDEEKELLIKLKNTGKSSWYLTEGYENRLVLGTYDPRKRFSTFIDGIYAEIKDESANEIIETNENLTFSLNFTAPQYPGYYIESFTPLILNKKRLSNEILTWEIYVEGDYSEGYNFEIQNLEEEKTGTNISKEIEIKVQNTGETPWYNHGSHPVKLIIDESALDNGEVKVEMQEKSVPQDGLATFKFNIDTPSEKGLYDLGLKLKIEDLIELDKEIPWTLNVTNKKVALTFDDGYGEIDPFLDVLKEQDVKATFFMLGAVAEANPEEMKRIVEEGHLLGNHSYDHPDFRNLSENEIERQLNTTRDIMQGITGIDVYPIFRYPYGAHNGSSDYVLTENGWQWFQWTNGTGDYQHHENSEEGRNQVYYYATLNPPDEAVVLFHIISKSTLAVLPDVIDWYRDNDYAFVTVDEL